MSDKTIKAPLPGTFYRQSDPGAGPFVDEGDSVRAGDVIGLVEIMKSFHEVKADEGGVVQRFLVENEDTVEAGQDLAVLDG
jgi:acetyl-CoA carboxylase biotin carboxyl carrier protein